MPCSCCFCRACCRPAGIPKVLYARITYTWTCVAGGLPTGGDGVVYYKLPLTFCASSEITDTGALQYAGDGPDDPDYSWADYPIPDICCGVYLHGRPSFYSITCDPAGGDGFGGGFSSFGISPIVPTSDTCSTFHRVSVTLGPSVSPMAICDCSGFHHTIWTESWTGGGPPDAVSSINFDFTYDVVCSKPPPGSVVIEPTLPPGPEMVAPSAVALPVAREVSLTVAAVQGGRGAAPANAGEKKAGGGCCGKRGPQRVRRDGQS
jgi:hypothetical protein